MTDTQSQPTVAEIATLRAKVEELTAALDEIARPIWYMQERAKASGDKIDGATANYLARDPEYLRAIASKALAVNSQDRA